MSLTAYKGMDVVENATGAGGAALTDDIKKLADRAPTNSTSDPGATDDSSAGYFAGSLWLNKTTQTMWVCTDATASSAVWKALYKRTGSSLDLIPQDSASNVTIAGNLGVGTTSPGARLHVAGDETIQTANDTNGGLTFRNPTTDSTHILYQLNHRSTNKDFWFFGYDGSTFWNCLKALWDNKYVVLVPDGTGSVGVGTAAPKARLHSTGATIVGASSAANADADLGNGQVNVWVDETNDKLMFKVKYSGGTVKSGSVNLV